MIVTETYCKCEICGKKMYEEETGHKRYQNYLELGSNVDPQFTKRYDDICDECTTAIQNTIAKRQGMSPLNMYFTDKLREICK